jgi:hypothetical protein
VLTIGRLTGDNQDALDRRSSPPGPLFPSRRGTL